MSLDTVVIVSVAIGLSFVLTRAVRRYALRHELIDVPNHRSSHTAPTPRGGGLAIVITVVLGLVAFTMLGHLDAAVMVALLPGFVAIAAVGFLDDRGHVAARWRLLVQFGAGGWIVYSAGALPALQLLGLTVLPGLVGAVLAVLATVWLINLYNFMDGIDGIAGVQTVTSGLTLCLLLSLSGDDALAAVAALVAAAGLGFLGVNWPPARIFMGDVGSGALGFLLAALIFWGFASGALDPWAGLIPLGVFIVDATWTLLRRLARRERVYEAHRSHAYQQLARRLGAHPPVVLGVLAVNVFWLLPLSLVAHHYSAWSLAVLLVAWTPLAWACVYLDAGAEEQRDKS